MLSADGARKGVRRQPDGDQTGSCQSANPAVSLQSPGASTGKPEAAGEGDADDLIEGWFQARQRKHRCGESHWKAALSRTTSAR